MNGNDQSMESNGTRVRHADPTHSQIPDEVSQVRKPPVLFLVIPCYREQEQLAITTPILEHKMGSMIDAKMISVQSHPVCRRRVPRPYLAGHRRSPP